MAFFRHTRATLTAKPIAGRDHLFADTTAQIFVNRQGIGALQTEFSSIGIRYMAFGADVHLDSTAPIFGVQDTHEGPGNNEEMQSFGHHKE